nr:hypothetical protein [Tanacetum cinerariifolium]
TLLIEKSKIAGPSEGEGPKVQDDREATQPPLTKEQIEGHLSAFRSIIKDHNRKNKTYPIRLDFDEEDTAVKDTRIVKGKEVVDDDLRKPFKEALKTHLTRRIIEFVGPEYKMPTNIKSESLSADEEMHHKPSVPHPSVPKRNFVRIHGSVQGGVGIVTGAHDKEAETVLRSASGEGHHRPTYKTDGAFDLLKLLDVGDAKSCILLDREGNAIQANLNINDEDYFNPKLKLGSAYRISNFSPHETKNGQFRRVKREEAKITAWENLQKPKAEALFGNMRDHIDYSQQ